VTEIRSQGQIITDFEGIKEAAVQTFEALYTETHTEASDPASYPLNLIQAKIQEEVNSKLIRVIDQHEIKEALDQLHPDKAPGPDGFTARFFQHGWNIIKSDLTKLIKKSQACAKIGGGTNSSFLALLPKEKGAASFDRFRPISLCNTSYKILTKLIANRLQSVLPAIIPENQGGFIKGRSITDNIILVQEALHSSLRRKDKGMIVKLDLSNAFDRVRHTFLFQVMERFGFAPSFISWIKACISGPWIAPLVNGRATRFFQASRGLRQGCPLSPLLYAIQASVLSLQLEFGQLQQNLSGLRIAKRVKDINHAQYADDTLLLGGASTTVAKKFKKELDVFTNISGSVINTAKSKIYGWNVNPREMHEISRILGIAGSTSWEDFNYLGVPITKAGSKVASWNKIIEKIKNRIRSWGANWLNLAGKLVLIKAVLSSISIYQSALLLAPRTVIQKIEVMIRHFLWEGGKQTGRRLHLVKWGKLTKSFQKGAFK
jgi:hypothetical protein